MNEILRTIRSSMISRFHKSRVALMVILAVSIPALVHADAPPGRYAASIDVVIDQQTGLEWQRVADSTTRSLYDSAAYCGNLALDGGGWRLPTFHELLSITDATRISPAIDPVAFPSTPSGGFWSSTTFAADPNARYWVVGFQLARVAPEPRGSLLYARCVR